jgi:hypothetical protein
MKNVLGSLCFVLCLWVGVEHRYRQAQTEITIRSKRELQSTKHKALIHKEARNGNTT